MTPIVLGVEGLTLTAAERDFLSDAKPWGVILFRRNIDSPHQLARLTEAVRAAGVAHVLIDQEGGRVARLGRPHWRVMPRPAAFAALYARNPALGLAACRLNHRLCAHDLHAVGIDIDLAPDLDVARETTFWAHGDCRTFGRTPAPVAALGRAACDGLLAGGVLPVIKHMPGHGGATEDSHTDLPVIDLDAEVLAAVDFAPFAALADMPAGLIAHVDYPGLDPARRPATFSPKVIGGAIRGRIGFDGLLLTDDLFMDALTGSYEDRIAGALAAGCEMPLFCHGDLRARARAVAAVPPPPAETAARIARAEAAIAPPEPFNADAAARDLAEMLAPVWSLEDEDWEETAFNPRLSLQG
ncbi:MAG: beta-N-acetylhexosaminidase [Pseudomonadota bacterium]